MSRIEQFCNAVPGGGRLYYSARWLGRLARIWRSPNRRFLAFPPGHYGSPLPDDAELTRDAARLFAVPAELPGIALRIPQQLQLLNELARLLADQPFADGPMPGLRYHFNNDFFPYSDGVVLFSMLRHFRPARVVEVGSGFSSALMLDTCDRFLDGRTQFTFIEPYPERLKGLLRPADQQRTKILEQRVQDVPREVFAELAANDVLFIDSSHVAKAGSDVNDLFFEVLPRLQPGVLVHVHDIFWPFEYPTQWYAKGYAWNEAYLLRALLQQSSAFEILLFPSYLEKLHGEDFAAALPLAMKRPTHAPTIGAASIWLRKV